MRIVVSGVPMDVQKKKIKNMYLKIKPPDGHVVISAPKWVNNKAIESFASSNIEYIKKSVAKYQSPEGGADRKYETGEPMYIWGKKYLLIFKPDNRKNRFEVKAPYVILSMRENSTVRQRETFVKEAQRELLKRAIKEKLPEWERRTGLKCSSWQTKYMITRWGTCNTRTRKIWFNLLLAQKPPACLDYIILHELTHLVTKNHNAEFYAHVAKYMPEWKEVRKLLNESPVHYFTAQ